MSRIGKLPIALPSGVDYTVDSNNLVTVKGAKGTLTVQLHPDIKLEKVENDILVQRPDDSNPAVFHCVGCARIDHSTEHWR